MVTARYTAKGDEKRKGVTHFAYTDDGHNDAAKKPDYKVEHYNGYAHRDGEIRVTETPAPYNREAAGATNTFVLKFDDKSGDMLKEVPPQMAKITTIIASNEFRNTQMNEPMAGVLFHELAREMLSDVAGKGDFRGGFRGSDFQKLMGGDEYYAPDAVRRLSVDTANPAKAIKIIETQVDTSHLNHAQASQYFIHQAGEQMKSALAALSTESPYSSSEVHVSNHPQHPAYDQAKKYMDAAKTYLAQAVKQDDLDESRRGKLADKVKPIVAKMDLVQECMDHAGKCFEHRFHDVAKTLVADGKGMHAGRARDKEAGMRELVTKYVGDKGMPRTVDELAKFADHVATQTRMVS